MLLLSFDLIFNNTINEENDKISLHVAFNYLNRDGSFGCVFAISL